MYITDEACKQEVTCYPAARAHEYEIVPKEITSEMKERHARARINITSDEGWWNSHSVVIVDQSGSMRTPDASACGTSRSDAVWVTLASSFIKEKLEGGGYSDRDVVSLVLMGEESELVIDREPLDWLLYNRVVRLLRSAEPKKARKQPQS